MKTGTDGFAGWMWSVVAVLTLPLMLWNLLTRDWAGVLINGTVAAMALFIARRAFKERTRLRRGSDVSASADETDLRNP
ncbi:hypothetical protein [Altericroceibacterium xinjiangense]|uniref:hypothetical protein n=1 Tax=Altericroceibacterium xinjiangense TaxID=762261 RepID=UPI000F7F53A1|nr:hypothetical protein [Altericroceibacterium xinjiangense]